jgi:hypothetical protein
MEIIAGLLSRAVLECDWTQRTVWTQTILTERRWNGDGTETRRIVWIGPNCDRVKHSRKTRVAYKTDVQLEDIWSVAGGHSIFWRKERERVAERFASDSGRTVVDSEWLTKVRSAVWVKYCVETGVGARSLEKWIPRTFCYNIIFRSTRRNRVLAQLFFKHSLIILPRKNAVKISWINCM